MRLWFFFSSLLWSLSGLEVLPECWALIAGALVFAVFLFEPRFSIMINDAGARNHLIWMVLIGVVVSDLLGAYSLGSTSTSKHS